MKIKVMPVEAFVSKSGWTITSCILQNADGSTNIVKVIGHTDYPKQKSMEIEVKAPTAYFEGK